MCMGYVGVCEQDTGRGKGWIVVFMLLLGVCLGVTLTPFVVVYFLKDIEALFQF